ncbi:hydrogenase subunit MbhD domain-containing protein [Ancylobacter terrae]|uniref:hydrogenase subunit MbhD domain-containing protein n=1 Tax=Ancylobacter sp. sgz301288 TaxID=3342077 RepID=UPI00385D186D
MSALLAAGLALLVVALAAWTLAQGDERTAVIGFIGLGLLLGLAWVQLGAVDVALTEAAVGGGATGVLLLRAIGALPKGGSTPPGAVDGAPPGVGLRLVIGVLCALVTLALAALVLAPQVPAPSLAAAAAEPLASTGLGNPVTAVLLAYRALDTLLEKVVLLLALIGIWSLAPDRLWRGAPAPLAPAVPAPPLVFLARTLPPIGILAGVYLCWTGADHPGGTFQSATILAAMWILVMMAGLREAPETGAPWLRRLLVFGPALFIAIGFAGFVVADGFLAYPPGLAKPLIVAIEAALTLSIAVILGLMVAGRGAREPAR